MLCCAVLAVTLSSCNEKSVNVEPEKLISQKKLTFSQSDLQKLEFFDIEHNEITSKIQGFLSVVQAQTANLRSSNTYTINELIFLLEGAENYLHTNGVIRQQDLITSETSFPLNYITQNGQPIFDDVDAIQLFNSIDAFVLQEYNAISGTDKDVAAVNVYPNLDDNGNLELGVSAIIEAGGGEEPQDGDCNLLATWKTHTYGTGQGICQGLTYSSADNAAERLTEIINDRNTAQSCNPHCQGYFTNILYTYISNAPLNPNDITLNDGYRDYMMFHAYSNQSQYTNCLSATEMDFYLDGAYETINFGLNYVHNQLGFLGNQFFLANMEAVTGFAGGNLVVTHIMHMFSGEFVPNGFPPTCYE